MQLDVQLWGPSSRFQPSVLSDLPADILVCEDNGEENGKEKSYTEKNRSGNETRQREQWKGGGGIDVAIKVMKA